MFAVQHLPPAFEVVNLCLTYCIKRTHAHEVNIEMDPSCPVVDVNGAL